MLFKKKEHKELLIMYSVQLLSYHETFTSLDDILMANYHFVLYTI